LSLKSKELNNTFEQSFKKNASMKNAIISSSIKELRMSKNLTQEELSEKCELSLRTIQRLENGESIPRGDTLKRLTSALDLPNNYFNNILFESKKNISVFNMPWYVIGFSIIGSALGFLLSLILANLEIIPYNEFSVPYVIAITILFCGIGIVTGNYFEKKYR
jgi:transcriptional regulator with XRE-family HTH domain